MTSIMLSFGICILFIGSILHAFNQSFLISVFLFPLGILLLFNYLIKEPDVRIRNIAKDINKEVVFATRFMIIELESGVPIYNVFVNITNIYPHIGAAFRMVVDKVDMGTMIEDAISETASVVPSSNLQRILWQMLNSIKTGAPITEALKSVVDQIVGEQKIEVEQYGRKLNPLAMFYMMIAVIVPSLGITMLIIFSSFIGFKLSLAVFLTLAGLLVFIQYMFFGMIKSSRPSVEF